MDEKKGMMQNSKKFKGFSQFAEGSKGNGLATTI